MEFFSVRRATLSGTSHSRPEAPISVRPGDTVHVSPSDTRRPGFEYVITADGRGWVPLRHLSSARPLSTVRFGYDTTELHADAGECVSVIIDDPHTGQSWCRADDGREGWLPRNILNDKAAR